MKKFIPLVLSVLFLIVLIKTQGPTFNKLKNGVSRSDLQGKYLGEKTGMRWIDTQVDAMGLRDRPIVKQDAYSTHFLQEDGQVKALFTAFKQNYEVSPGHWEPIDYSLEKSDDPNYDFKTKNGVGIYLSQNGQILNKEKGHEVGAPKMGWYDIERDTFTPLDNLDNPKVKTEENRLTMQGNGVHLIVYAYDTGAREDLILENSDILKTGRPWEELVLKTEISTEDNVYVNGTKPSKTQELTEKDVLEIVFDKGKVLLPFPDVWDSKNQHGPIRRFLKNEDENWFLYTTISHTWLSSKSREYPITIDPTYSSQPDETDGIDNNPTSQSATSVNFRGDTAIWVGEPNNLGASVYRGLIKFDFTSIPSGSTVDSATFSLWLATDQATNARTFSIYRLKRAWVESQATWNIYSTGNNWQTAGGFGANDAEQTEIASRAMAASEAAGEKQWTNWDGSLLATMFGNSPTFTNNGFLLKVDTESDDGYIYRASNYATAAERPKMVIVYTWVAPTAPTIGTPTALSTTSIRWNFTDNASTEDGFKVYADVPFSATGGTITESGGYAIHTFTSSGTFTPNNSGSVEVLLVGGGGGGANGYGGGGGGGGIVDDDTVDVTAQGYTVTVGAGGAGGAAHASVEHEGLNGADSTFAGLTAIGGGGGARNSGPSYNGGSGGGGTNTTDGGIGSQGGNGGDSSNSGPYYGSGGGGGAAPQNGGNGTSGAATGVGGNGKASSITGTSVTRGGGGGGGIYSISTGSVGGTGGGGNGGIPAVNGTVNTGGGGGGSSYVSSRAKGGDGGSGVVIIRYLNGLLVTCATANLTYCDETGLSVNTQYTRKVVAYNSNGNSAYSSTASAYTLPNAAGTPTVSSSGSTTANVIVAINSNPAATEFAIQETGSGNYVNKSTGALQASESWGTYAEFGSGSGITVTSLSVNTQYTFKIKARNGDNTETAFGGTATAYTRAATPPAPTIDARATTTTQPVTPSAGTNPAGTTLAIYKEVGTTCDGTGGSYLAADGSDNSSTAVWQTAASWGTKTVTGLSQDLQYAFCVVARNGDNIATSFGDAGSYNSCFPGISGNHTITQDCSLPSVASFIDGNDVSRKVGGVDSGTGSGQDSNTAKITVQSGILTVNADETIAAGSFELTGGSIAIATGGVLKVGTPIWVVDADADGFPAVVNKLYIQADAPTNGRRRNLMTRIAIGDCDETVYTPNGCFRRNVALTYSGATLTNHDVVFSMDTATAIADGKMQGDCGDIRVKDSDASTLLTYWIEGGCNTTNTQIWARVPSIPDGGKTIYLDYHGGAIANGFESWAGTFTLAYNASCPAGWTQNSSFDNAFPQGATTYGGTGGSASHSHAQVSCTASNNSGNNPGSSGSGAKCAAAKVHSHTSVRADVSTNSSVLPAYLDVVMCKNADLVVPASFIAMFDTSVPSGWTRFSTLDSTFPRGATTYGGTGGATTHSHSTTGGYGSGNSGTICRAAFSGGSACGNHAHTSSSGSTGTGDNTPPYLDMVFGQADAQTVAAANLVSIVDVLPPLGWTRFSALDDKFPRGASSYGGTGGASTSNHSVTVSHGSACGSIKNTTGAAGNIWSSSHAGSCGTSTDSQSNTPPYVNAIYAERNTPSPSMAVGSEAYWW